MAWLKVFETKEIVEYPRSKVLKEKGLTAKLWKHRRNKGEAKKKAKIIMLTKVELGHNLYPWAA